MTGLQCCPQQKGKYKRYTAVMPHTILSFCISSFVLVEGSIAIPSGRPVNLMMAQAPAPEILQQLNYNEQYPANC